MANPMKVISKATKVRDAARKKAYSAAPGVERGKKSSRTSPLPTAGKQKAINKGAKLNTKIEKYTDGQYYVTPNRAGNKIVASGNRVKETPITGPNKTLNKNIREAYNKIGAKNKLTNKPIVRLKKIEKKTPKVPVKKRGK